MPPNHDKRQSLQSLPSLDENDKYEDDGRQSDALDQVGQVAVGQQQSPNGLHQRARLSAVSKEYDTGNKGFLTRAERELRAMDTGNAGTLSNAQVAVLMEQKLRSDEIIQRLRRLLWFLGAMTVLLILSNLGTAWAAAILAKDSVVDVDTGELRMKANGGTGVVTTRPTGDAFAFGNVDDGEGEEEEEEDAARFCITPKLAAQMWHDAASGTPVTAFFDYKGVPNAYSASPNHNREVADLRALSLTSDGSMINGTHACIGTPGGSAGDGAAAVSHVCIDFVSGGCDAPAPDAAAQEGRTEGPGGGGDGEDEGGDFFDDGGDNRRRLFHSALRELELRHGMAVNGATAAHLRGQGPSPSAPLDRRGLVPVPTRPALKDVCKQIFGPSSRRLVPVPDRPAPVKECKTMKCCRKKLKAEKKKKKKKRRKWRPQVDDTIVINVVSCEDEMKKLKKLEKLGKPVPRYTVCQPDGLPTRTAQEARSGPSLEEAPRKDWDRRLSKFVTLR